MSADKADTTSRCDSGIDIEHIPDPTSCHWGFRMERPAHYWLLGKAIFLLIVLFSWGFFVANGPQPPDGLHQQPVFIRSLVHWDAWHYLDIAQRGYDVTGSDVAFYPLYPFLIRQTSALVFQGLGFWQTAVSALLIANIASLFVIFSLNLLCRDHLGDTARHLCLLLWVTGPTAVFLSVGYTEALFMALALGGIVRSRKGDWIGAGLLIGLACLCRPVGIFAYILLLHEFVLRHRKDQVNSKGLAHLGLVLPASAIFGHHFYQAVYFFDPFANIHAEHTAWNRRLMAPWNFPAYLADALTNHEWMAWKAMVIYFVLYLIGACLVATLLFTSKRFPFSYKVFTVLILLSIVCQSSEMAIPRFLMVAFPLYMALSDWCARGSGGRAYLVTVLFVVLNVLGTVLFLTEKPFF